MKKTSILFLIIFMVSTMLACGTNNPEPNNKPNPEEPDHPEIPDVSNPEAIRVMVYNIRHGRGMDNIVGLHRILEVIKNSEASIVALNEIDRHYGARSNYEDQVKSLADALDMHYVYQPTTTEPANTASGNKPREHGHALLSKYAIVESEKRDFSVGDDYGRGILRAKLNVDGQNLQVYVTHWGLTEAARFNHIKETVMFMNDYPGKSVLMGDLNATPDEHNIITLKSRLLDATEDNAYTFNAETPTKKIDYIFASGDMDITETKVINTTASDHRPIVADINLDKEIDNSLLYPNFPESFEVTDGNFINYEGGDRVRTFPSGAWNFTQAAIVNNPRYVYDDRPTSGIDVVRMRNNLTTSAYVQMDFDLLNGASKVTVWYSVYFKDASSTWRLEYSTDGGTTWTQTGSDISDAGFVKKQAVFNMDITGPVRFRINKLGLGTTNNGRLCIDDFAIYKK
ncbi:hypothetical protein FXV77_18645 [Sphingobacterium phlebotomi]|uniref:Endonuclease/exonuclease/phosphatase domain-containing protein n=1 Tax=Sphingobacterium phlebotomi TaxID=2605433 RepID=A0A5D4GWF6_9SPHI|nr:endonuclease/exonuclease/phosphatase family protein [Sphingobacterium phlebotomi]TYR32627.1 hypothetical protein FXV77_18645 [Sphingobacterium phlebotomi]